MSDFRYEWLENPPEIDEDEEEPKRFYGVATGRVINQADPMFLSRVQVQLPWIDDADLSPWARVAVPMSGILFGMYFMPELGDEVLVAFEHGDVNVPYVIGSLWNGLAPPPFPTPYAQMRTIRTPLMNQLTFIEAPPTIILASPAAGQTITLSEAGTTIISGTGAQIIVGGAVITVNASGVQIAGTTISLAATTALNLTAPAVNIAATGNCTITGGMVLINPV